MLQRIGIGIGMTAAACTLLVAPAGAKSGHGEAKKAAVQACKQERQADPAVFATKYGRQAVRNCMRETLAATVVELRNAAQECRAEREEMGVEAFRLEYGNNHNGRNAFGKCVSEKVHEEEPEVVEGDGTGTTGDGTATGTTGDGDGTGTTGDGDGTGTATGEGVTVVELRNAAQECRAEREEMGVEAFRLEYGNNHNGRNAFGKCVSEKVHEEEPEVVEGDGTGTGTTGDGTGTGDAPTTDPPPA